MPKRPAIVEVHARLFGEDVDALRKIAAERGTTLQIELRILVRRALKGEKREFLVVSEDPKK